LTKIGLHLTGVNIFEKFEQKDNKDVGVVYNSFIQHAKETCAGRFMV
jgi:hypothetical protein